MEPGCKWWRRTCAAALVLSSAAAPTFAQAPDHKTEFRIKYVAEGVVYIDGGRAAGLAEKMKMTARRDAAAGSNKPATVVAELEIVSIAESSAVCEIKTPGAVLKAGDTAVLSTEDAQKSQLLRSAGRGEHYAQTIAFNDGDPLDEEVRELMPHPPLPEVNRVRGRFGFEYNSIRDQGGAGGSSSETALVVRTDMTRIGGTYWNLSGYTRLLLNSTNSGSQQQTLNDLLNRTYHLRLYYDNPQSNWTAGFGRFYLPWAASLDTIDGGYLARRFSKTMTVGIFAGSTPDPTSWNYNPNREMAGTFVSFEGGSYEGFRYTSTSGVGITHLNWKPEREFVFFENSFSFKRYFSVYDDLQVDRMHPTIERPTANGTGVSRSFLTLRFEPSKIIQFDLSHNYFREFPTFDPRLVGTGLLDKFLFQGLSGGFRLSLPYHTSVYASLGRSSGSSDAKGSWNQMYGAEVSNILGTGIRADLHYTHFASAFGHGAYEALSLSRQLRETLRFELQAGQQNFVSPFTTQTRGRFINTNLDWAFSIHYFLSGGITVYRGSQSYNQTAFTLGYRF